MRRLVWTVAGFTLVLGACAYYNGLYNANQLAGQARQAEREGRQSEARSLWSRAAVKAESVVVRHPHSRYRDDALLLRGTALYRLNSFGQAITPLRVAADSSPDRGIRAEALLLLARCRLELSQPESVLVELEPLIAAENASRREEALLLRGRARLRMGEDEAALADLSGTVATEAAFPRALALGRLGRPVEAESALVLVLAEPYDEAPWLAVLDSLGRRYPEPASRLVEQLLARPDLAPGERRRLLLGDGERRLAAGDDSLAVARLTRIAETAPDSAEGTTARAHLAVRDLLRARQVAGLPALRDSLNAAVRRGGRAAQVGGPYLSVLTRAVDATGPEASTLSVFLAAEDLRDSLRNAALAADMFGQLVARDPESVLAPKAILALAALQPEAGDSLVGILRQRYPTSVYTLALDGSAGDAYQVVEDSLQTAIREELRARARGRRGETGRAVRN